MPGAAASRESRTDQPERTQWFTDPRTPVRTRRGAAPGSRGGAETGGGRLVADAAGRSLASVPGAAAPRRALRRFLVGTTAGLGAAFEPHPQRRLGELGLLRGATAVGPRQCHAGQRGVDPVRPTARTTRSGPAAASPDPPAARATGAFPLLLLARHAPVQGPRAAGDDRVRHAAVLNAAVRAKARAGVLEVRSGYRAAGPAASHALHFNLGLTHENPSGFRSRWRAPSPCIPGPRAGRGRTGIRAGSRR